MLNDTIKDIIVTKNLSPSRFADEIGVQRSSISHILSGRNKPSLDIVQKIIRRFPELGTDWLLEDHTDNDQSDKDDGAGSQQSAVKGKPSAAIEPTTNTQEAKDTEVPEIGEKQVVKVMVFYNDGTFSEFTPATKPV